MTGAMPRSLSPGSRFTSFTPCVLRPHSRMPCTGMRTIWPPAVMSMISSVSFTVSAPTTPPVLSPVFMVMMPLPPRDWTRYSPKSVRLPMPFSPATSKVASGTTMAAATTVSPLSKVMPFTPPAARPMLRTSDSQKRMLMPPWVMRTTPSPGSVSPVLPRVSLTSMSVSPGSMPMAMMPPLRTLPNSLSVVFFTVPCCVAKKSSPGCCQVMLSLFASSLDWMRMRAAIFSFAWSSSRLAMLRPFEARPMSGISWTRSTYTRPVFVKNMR